SFPDDGIDNHQVNTASPQVNTASPQVNTGSREVNHDGSHIHYALTKKPEMVMLTPSSSPTPEPSPSQPSPPHPSPSQHSPPQPGTAYPPPTPHDSPLHAIHSHGREEGSLKLQELMGLITTLSDRIGILEADLSQTKKIYSSAYTKLILRVKKLESQIKVGKARRHSRFVLSDNEVGEDDSSKQGRKFSNEGFQNDEGVHEKVIRKIVHTYIATLIQILTECP
ncbi:hypothetical protein Tco_1333893, partial [Tanacetum coccineum]